MAVEPRVFISYASDTKTLAETLTQALRRQGIPAWADFDLLPGQQWKSEVEQALERSGQFIFLLGPKSRATQSQEWEWRAALEKAWTGPGKTIIPVVVGADQPPPFLREWVSLRVDPTSDESADWTEQVMRVLRAHNVPAHGLSPSDKLLRSERFREIASAVEELRASTHETPPADANK